MDSSAMRRLHDHSLSPAIVAALRRLPVLFDVNAIDATPMLLVAPHCCRLPLVPSLLSMSLAGNTRMNGPPLWKDLGAAVPGGWDDLDGPA
ncbi:hypothetical protein V3C99_011114 [Haemonchus contortus]|uniref:Uncharacterized protein n=1 Tax=Haemonchus contortus TaxID=6289 RepID=A0A7I5E805_HAECO